MLRAWRPMRLYGRAVRPPLSDKTAWRSLDRSACEAATSELLAIVFQGLRVERRELERVARGIDSGGFDLAAGMPDVLVPTSAYREEITVALRAVLEIARRAALPARPCLVRGPDDVAIIARREVGALRRERVIVIVCDAANRHRRTIAVSDGAIDRSLIPIREILSAVLRWDGRAFAVAHNHTAEDPAPSEADIEGTRHLEDAARRVGLRFLGHVVVTNADHRVIEITTGTRRPD